MKALLQKVFFLSVMLDNVPEVPGKLIRKHNAVPFLKKALKYLSAAKVSSLANMADKVMDIICQSPHLNLMTQ